MVRIAGVFGLAWRSYRYEVVVGYHLNEHVPAPTRPSEGANLQLDTLKLRFCYAPLRRAIELDACAAAEGGWFFTRGQGESSTVSKPYPWGAALLGLRLAWVPSRVFEARIQAEGGAPLLRPRFEITGSNPAFVHQPPPYLGQVVAGVFFRFP
jgi:hypothetical protein